MASEQKRELVNRLEREHAETPHPGMDASRTRLHLAIHTVVENQLEEGVPAEVGSTLRRLTEQGLTRHQAIHAIGAVAAEEVLACLSRGEAYDAARYEARLQALDADDPA